MLTIYKASAGSGKTYNLALRYITMLLGVKTPSGSYVLNHRNYLPEGDRPRTRTHSNILAITFTNKATTEMKERIISELEALSHMPDPNNVDAQGKVKDANYAEALTRAFGCTRSELCEVAALSLRGLLFDYNRFNVSTIDAFFQTILRSFAREIDRQGDFRLELDSRTVVDQAMALVFDEVNRDPNAPDSRPVRLWLDAVARQRMTDGDDFNPFNRSMGMYKDVVWAVMQAFSEDFIEHQDEMLEYFENQGRIVDFARDLQALIRQTELDEAAELRDVDLALSNGLPTKEILKLIENVRQAGGLDDNDIIFNRTAVKYKVALFQDHDGSVCFKARSPHTLADELVLAEWAKNAIVRAKQRQTYKKLLKSTTSLAALMYIYRYIDRYRQENNMIVISDTNTLLGSIIGEGEDTPFIYERVGVELNHFLIDEFQDTSRLQWQNLKPLLANALSSRHDSLIIGDVKQSIYRFRGGDPRLLQHEVQTDETLTDAQAREIKGLVPAENTNYRSAHDVVRFNNTIFSRLALAGATGRTIPGYIAVPGADGGVTQALGSKTAGLGSYIRVVDLVPDKVNDITLETISRRILGDDLTQKLIEADDLTDKNVGMHFMAQNILGQLERGYTQGQIAILVRVNKQATEIADFIMANYPQIHLVSDEALMVRNSQAVKMILSVLEIIDKSYGEVTPNDSEKAPSTFTEQPTPAAAQPAEPTGESEVEQERRRRYRQRRRKNLLVDSFNYYMARGLSMQEAVKQALERSLDALRDIDDAEEKQQHDIYDDIAAIRSIAPTNLPVLIEAIIGLKISEEQRRAELPYIAAFIDIVEQFTSDFNPSIHAFLNYWREKQYSFTIPAGQNIDAVTIMTVHKAKGLEWDCVHLPNVAWSFAARPENVWLSTENLTAISADKRPPMMYLETDAFISDPASPFYDQVCVYNDEQTADNLNTAYVAFTRAGRELIVSLLPKTRNQSSPTFRDALLTAISKPFDATDPNADLYIDLESNNDAVTGLTIGEPTTPNIKSDKTESVENESGTSDKWTAPEFRVAFSSINDKLTTLVDLAGMDAPDTMITTRGEEDDRHIVDRGGDSELKRVAARRGILLHSILEHMTTIDDIDRALQMVRRFIPDNELPSYREELLSAFERAEDKVRRWFSPDNRRVLTEQSILIRGTDTIRRIDRMIETNEGDIEVIDYKFTSHPHKSHEEQMRDYIVALQGLMPNKTIRGYLWYPLLTQVLDVNV